ncbi:MAG: hypothetical protein Q8Q00_08435 [Dehalococcoidia bacterium]|nr:hypothetical protein [Dehalococcoidia bacterium]
MSMLTEQEYEEYIRLLRGWVDAEKALEGPGAPDSEASGRAREAHAAVQTFRERHGLGGEGTRPEAPAPVYARRRGQAEA